MKKIDVSYDILTGEETIVERDETAQEKKQREIFTKMAADELAEAEAKATAKAALLDKLGITAEEAALLLS
jgi:hypothetical protein